MRVVNYKRYYLSEEESIEIRVAMLRKGYRTIVSLSEATKFSEGYIGNILRGGTPYPKIFDDALKSLGIDVIHIYDKEEEQNETNN